MGGFYARCAFASIALAYVLVLTVLHTHKLLTREAKIELRRKQSQRSMSVTAPTNPNFNSRKRTATSENPPPISLNKASLASSSEIELESSHSGVGGSSNETQLTHGTDFISSRSSPEPRSTEKTQTRTDSRGSRGSVGINQRERSSTQQKLDSLKKHLDLSHIFVYGSLLSMAINYTVNLIDFIPSIAGENCFIRQYVTTVTYLESHLFVFVLFIRRIETTFKGSYGLFCFCLLFYMYFLLYNTTHRRLRIPKMGSVWNVFFRGFFVRCFFSRLVFFSKRRCRGFPKETLRAGNECPLRYERGLRRYSLLWDGMLSILKTHAKTNISYAGFCF